MFIRQTYVLVQSDLECPNDSGIYIGVVKDQNIDCIPLQYFFDKNNAR